MTRLFRYILKDDKGMAPCVEDGIMTLATCKPRIRGRTEVGDWIAGFMPSPYEPGLLVYAGRVARILDWGPYENEFQGRGDAVYRVHPNGREERLLDDYHADERMDDDLSAPVVVFDKNAFWYFGGKPERLPDRLMHLAVVRIRDYVVNGAKKDDEKRLEKWLRSKHPPGVHGEPRHGGTCYDC